MNHFGISLIWLVGQVTLLCVVTAVIYLIARRRHPTAGATAVLSGLLLTVVLSLGMFSPWPRWSFERGDDAPAVDKVEVLPSFDDANLLSSGTPTTDVDSDFVSNRSETAHAQPAMESRAVVAWRTFWSSLGKELSEPTPPATDAGIRWTGWLAMGLLFAVLIGAVRLISGWVTVRGYLRRSKLISDRSLSEMTDILRAELECSREVELRESADVVSPAMFGLRRPVILLPPDWNNWSQNERRAVLAHELAHVTSGDAATWLAAQFGLMMHFYHPLMHWLAQRLRLEQELAADALAARSLGDSQTYLTTLAELAVRQPDRPLAWPARAFLPTRGTLLRRIEMLRDTKAQPLRSSILRRGTVIALTVIVGLFVAGLRPPELRQALAQEGTTTDTRLDERGIYILQEREGFNLENVPASTTMLLGIRPGRILQRDKFQQLLPLLEGVMQFSESELELKDIDQALLFATTLETGPVPIIELRMNQPTDFSAFIKERMGEVKEEVVGDRTLLVSVNQSYPNMFPTVAFLADDRTIVYGWQGHMQKVFKDGSQNNERPAWHEQFQFVAGNDACIVADVAAFRPLIDQSFQEAPNPIHGMFVPLWEKADLAIGGARLDDRLTATLNIWGKDTESVDKIEQTLRTLIPVGQGMLEGYKASLNRMPNDTQAVVKPIVDFAASVLSDVQIEKSDEKVDVTFEGDGASLALAAVVTLPAIQQAREAARRTQSSDSLSSNTADFAQELAPPEGKLTGSNPSPAKPVVSQPETVAENISNEAEELEQDSYVLTRQGLKLSAEEAMSLEKGLETQSNNLAARTQLLGYYSANRNREAQSRHVIWLIENQPDARITGSPYARLDPVLDTPQYFDAREAWLKQVERHSGNATVLGNAAAFFLIHDREKAESLLVRAQTLEPENPHWAERLGRLFQLQSHSLMRRGDAAAKKQVAVKALEQFEKALQATTVQDERSSLLIKIAKSAFESGDMQRANDAATEVLEAASVEAANWNTGNAIHHGNLILGRIALHSGDTALAKEFLLKAGKTTGSPQLNSFGPNMLLAKELLEHGERETVLQYFELCSKFWNGRLADWTKQVEQGDVPNFGANLNY